MRRHHTNSSNIITWKVIRADRRLSIVYSPDPMLMLGIPIWWGGLFLFCFLFYRLAPEPYNVFAIVIAIPTAALQAILVGFRLRKEKRLGDYLHLDLEAKTIDLPRSGVQLDWGDRRPVFCIDQFRENGDLSYEFNVELADGRCLPILHSIAPAFSRIASTLSQHGFTVQKRYHIEG